MKTLDMQVMCSTPVLFAYGRPVEQALYCAQMFNDAGLELAARGQGRLKTLCQVPLQDTDAACRELSRAMRSGHLGVQIGNHVGDRDLDDEGIVTFLQHCAAEGAAVLVHPWDMMGGARTAAAASPSCSGGSKMPGTTAISRGASLNCRPAATSTGSTSTARYSTTARCACWWRSWARIASCSARTIRSRSVSCA